MIEVFLRDHIHGLRYEQLVMNQRIDNLLRLRRR